MAMQLGGKGYKAEINVTPLVDVVLVLLIIFMVVTPLMQRSKAVELPQAKNVTEEEKTRESMLVIVSADGALSLELDDVDEEGLEAAIRERLSFNPGVDVIVKGDKRLDYGRVREVMQLCRKAGAKRVVLATKERREEGA